MELEREICSDSSAAALEFPAFLELVAGGAATDVGRRAVLARRPVRDVGELRRRQARTEEVARLLLAGAVVPSMEDAIEPLLERLAASRADLEGVDLLLLARVLRTSGESRRRILGDERAFPELRRAADPLLDLSALVESIERSLDPRGNVRDDASALLRRLRKDVRRVRDRLYREFKVLLGAHSEHFSEETIPLHAGRLCLLLNSGSRGRIAGLVHGRSSTGRSFYFEPLDAVESNNELQSLLEEERAEKLRILAELADEARQRRPEIEEHVAFLAGLDVDQAACRWMEVAAGVLAEVCDRGALRLVGARHPLLDPRLAGLRASVLGHAGHVGPVVPLDLDLTEARRLVVVTGPNAGGKTAALKTLGLLALAHQSGLPIPAELGTHFPLLDHIVATIGDDQDLLADQSTFSGRLLRLKEVWERSGEDSLVLLDELGSGTDPEEGAALSMTLLEGLIERRSLGLVTTHLTVVATLAMEADGAACAAMQFDDGTGRPTYRLRRGAPGGSHAIDLARRMELPAEWLDRAEARLGDDHRRLRVVLSEVEQLRGELEGERRAVAAERDDLAAREVELVAELERLEAARADAAKGARRELREFRQEVQKQLREELDRVAASVRRSPTEGGRKPRRRTSRQAGAVGEAVERLFAEVPPVAAEAPAEAQPVAVGQEVEHLSFGWNGTVERMEKGRVWVRVRGMSMAVSESELRPATSRVTAAVARPSRAPKRWPERPVDAPRELKLIGQRVEPALEALDRFLDQALLAEHDDVRIVHGHGSGRLRDGVREHLRGHRAVDRWQRAAAEQGGDGATLVVLKRS